MKRIKLKNRQLQYYCISVAWKMARSNIDNPLNYTKTRKKKQFLREKRAARRKKSHEELVKRIRSFLVMEPMVYGKKDFYNYYARRFGTQAEKLAIILHKMDHVKGDVTFEIENIGCVKFVDDRVDYRRRPKEIEFEKTSKDENLSRETAAQVEKNVRQAKAGKRDGPPAKIKLEDKY